MVKHNDLLVGVNKMLIVYNNGKIQHVVKIADHILKFKQANKIINLDFIKRTLKKSIYKKKLISSNTIILFYNLTFSQF